MNNDIKSQPSHWNIIYNKELLIQICDMNLFDTQVTSWCCVIVGIICYQLYITWFNCLISIHKRISSTIR